MTKRKQLWTAIPIALVILGLVISNICFIRRANTPDCCFMIGVPQVDGTGEIAAIDYSKSAQLVETSDINVMIYALLQARPAADVQVPTAEPDAVISMRDPARGIGFHAILWLSEDSIVFTMNPDDPSDYRITYGTYADALNELVREQLSVYE